MSILSYNRLHHHHHPEAAGDQMKFGVVVSPHKGWCGLKNLPTFLLSSSRIMESQVWKDGPHIGKSLSKGREAGKNLGTYE